MYHSYFGLNAHPFKLTPDPSFFFEEGQRKAILDALVFALRNGEGIIKLTGEVGSGKTFLSRILEQALPDNFTFVFLLNPNMPPQYVLAAIARDLGIELPQQADKLQVLHALQEYLLQLHSAGKQVIVVLDEAQCMSPETLEEVRLLSNLETGSHKLLQILLIGQPELDNKLKRHDIRQIRERITHSLFLPALKHREIHRYIDYRLRCAGYRGAPLFGRLSTALIAFQSRGLLRRINILADKAMLVAFSRGGRAISLSDAVKSVCDSPNGQPRVHWFSRIASIVLLMALAATTALWPAAWNGLPDLIRPLVKSEKPQQSSEPRKISDVAAVFEARPIIRENNLQNRITESRQWINRPSTQGYSIQLMQTYSEQPAPLKQFFDRSLPAELKSRTYVFPTKMNDKTLWSIFFGEFNSYADASAALQTLDETLMENHPFIVSLNSIKGLYGQNDPAL